VAAAGKLLDLDGSRRAVEDFGLGRRVARPVGLLLPVVELALAATLIPVATARWAALAAACLLAVFSVAIARSLLRGAAHDCHCFGALGSSRVGPAALARNAALAALAVVVASLPAAEAGWVALSAVSAAALVAAQAWLWLELLRRYGRALRRIDELEAGDEAPVALKAGSPAPPFVLPDLDGQLVSFDDLLGESAETILLFTSPGCGACDLALENAGTHRGFPVVAISTGDHARVAATAARYDIDPTLLDEEGDVARRYGVKAMPTAVLVDADGLVAAEPGVGAPEVGELLRRWPGVQVAARV
jgi:peroxiredoxin